MKKGSLREVQQYSKKHLLMAKYFANQLALKRSGSEVERIGTTLYSSKIELTPRQIQAALFAFKSPLDKGVILADEVGLGKTIEAGIVIAQNKYEKDEKVLIVAPASLMEQWEGELEEKFGLSAIIMDRKQYRVLKKSGVRNPFNVEADVIICSYQMCASLKEDVFASNIQLVVLDEAHKLRNVHNEKSVTANNVKAALTGKKKILLTATPIQNNLMDLYGLASIIDEGIFGDKSAFRYNYIRNFDEYEEDLNERLKPVLHRTLRKQVSHYIKFTNRLPQTYTFEQNEQEKEVYDLIRQLILNSEEETYLIPAQQRHLVVLILCKLLGSSTAAIASTLEKMRERLIKMKEAGEYIALGGEIYESEDMDIEEDGADSNFDNDEVDLAELQREINELDLIIAKANVIKSDSKYEALLRALTFSFEHLKEIGANEKVLIFTESKKTQQYLVECLRKDGYENVITYNGTNTDEASQEIYKKWGDRHPEEISSNNKTVNMKAAILECFRDNARILIATEAGAEGLNLQFCSLVINYDLPWNPQRVEQRIGRCHRLGQQFDVVVVNFISATNIVEQRIYELLNTKFRIFDEILGSSDSIMGKLEDGKDIETSILNIYKTCRTVQEIEKAFDELQDLYKDEIDESMNRTRQELLDNFEEDVQELFRNMMGAAEKTISRIERYLWRLTTCLIEDAKYDETNRTFITSDGYLHSLIKSNEKGIWHNLNAGLGKELVEYGVSIPVEKGHVVFDITNYRYNLGKVQELKGKKGVILLSRLSINAFETEEYLVFNGVLENGTRLDEEVCKKLFRLTAEEQYMDDLDVSLLEQVQDDQRINIQTVINHSQERNNELISEKINQINAWADDKIEATQLKVEEMRTQRKELQRQSDSAVNMIEKERIESEIMAISKKIRMIWMKLADDEEEIEDMRRKMISDIRKEVLKETEVTLIFAISFEVK